MSTRSAFTLLEVMIALIVFAVGVLGSVGMTLQAQRTFQRAVALEAASRTVAAVSDSLFLGGWSGAGTRVVDRGRVRWSGQGDGVVTVTYNGDSGLVLSVGLVLEKSRGR